MKIKELLEQGVNPISLVIDRRPRNDKGELFDNRSILLSVGRPDCMDYDDECVAYEIVTTLSKILDVDQSFEHATDDDVSKSITVMRNMTADCKAESITFIDDLRFHCVNSEYREAPMTLVPYLFRHLYEYNIIQYQIGNDLYSTVFFGKNAIIQFVHAVLPVIIKHHIDAGMVVELSKLTDVLYDMLDNYMPVARWSGSKEFKLRMVSAKEAYKSITKLLGENDLKGQLAGYVPDANRTIIDSIIAMYCDKLNDTVINITNTLNASVENETIETLGLTIEEADDLIHLIEKIRISSTDSKTNTVVDFYDAIEYGVYHGLDIVMDYLHITVGDIYGAIMDAVAFMWMHAIDMKVPKFTSSTDDVKKPAEVTNE